MHVSRHSFHSASLEISLNEILKENSTTIVYIFPSILPFPSNRYLNSIWTSYFLDYNL